MATPTDDPSRTEAPVRPPLWRRPRALLIGGVMVILLGVVVVVFQPQRLLYDVTVDEAFPTIADTSEQPSEVPPDPAETALSAEEEAVGTTDEAELSVAEEADPSEGTDPSEATDLDGTAAEEAGTVNDGPTTEELTGPVALASGTFASRNRYTTTGSATVFELPSGTRTLRLEDFETTNGPDLYVYLTVADAADGDADLDTDVVDLGVLRGNVGNQNYEVPDDIDLEVYDTVVIWCLRFTTSFGVADLSSGA